MKNRFSSLVVAVLLCAGAQARAQDVTNAVPPTLEPPTPVQKIFDFMGQGSNWIVAPYAIYSSGGTTFKDSAGAGIAIAYKLSDFVVPMIRIDELGGKLYMPSMSLNLQVPLHFGKLVVIPFGFAGIATPIGGAGDDNLTAQSIVGVGFAAQLTKHLDLVADWEKWSAIKGDQYRLGFAWKF